jgi:TPR repeat protein
MLALLHIKGDGVEQDYEKGRHYLERAAEQNYANALYKLGLLYVKGHGVEKNYEMGRHYL